MDAFTIGLGFSTSARNKSVDGKISFSDGFHRWDLNDVAYFPKMPILPISYENAEKLMK